MLLFAAKIKTFPIIEEINANPFADFLIFAANIKISSVMSGFALTLLLIFSNLLQKSRSFFRFEEICADSFADFLIFIAKFKFSSVLRRSVLTLLLFCIERCGSICLLFTSFIFRSNCSEKDIQENCFCDDTSAD